MDIRHVKFPTPACYSAAVDSAHYLKGLNEAQKEAALHREGPLLIVAGAGAGKTKTITHRIAHLLSLGVPGTSVLAITFTNKAAGEMRERVRGLLGQGMHMPLLCTFHALGVRILREFHDLADVPHRFTIWDRDDSIKALKKVLASLGEDLAPRGVLAAISRAKGDGVSRSDYTSDASDHWKRSVARVWELYDKTLADEGALDFDDLLACTLALFKKSPSTLALLQNRWTYLTIDEYQDTNKAQMEIARLLAGGKMNICAVGDIDQCVYSWRQARPENLLEFETIFPGTKTVTLEENYRSTRTILAAANAIIEKNVRRKPKNLFTQNETGGPILFYSAENELDEAWFVADRTAQLLKSGARPESIAVLYRENFQSRVLEEAFLHLSLPYRVLGTRFFERKEVKDVLAYLRAALNPKARTDIARAVSVPARGIGKITLEKMLAGNENIPKSARAKIETFRETLHAIRKAIESIPCSEAVHFAIQASGIEEMLKRDKEDGAERLGNVRELVNLATKFDYEPPPQGIERLLDDAALQSEQDELDHSLSKKEGAASLMTIHASKGLEFDTVFVTGLEQGLFPSERASDTERDPEEERRLFYVAVTRAGKRLYLSCARARMKYGSRDYAIPSEFLDDIDPRLVARAAIGEAEERVID